MSTDPRAIAAPPQRAPLRRHLLLPAFLMLLGAAPVSTIARVDGPMGDLRPLPVRIEGRVERRPDGSILRQWPATYVEARFTGSAVFFRVGDGKVSLRVSIDAADPLSLVAPAAGLYCVSGLTPGEHRIRVAVASESQNAPTSLGGFLVRPAGVRPAPARRSRSIEFIGDSHTVGYGNTLAAAHCSNDQVWNATDATRGFGPLIARHYDADYRINAISGRGIVRNYDGHALPTLPQAYGFELFDRRTAALDAGWSPQIVVISLGTNDFSTPLHPGERWADAAALDADFEANYMAFVERLHLHWPKARLILWATDFGGGAVERAMRRVAQRLDGAGHVAVEAVPIDRLSFAACNGHPTLGDDQRIAAALIAQIDQHPDWTGDRNDPDGKRHAAAPAMAH